MVDEVERSLHDALSVLSQTVKETRVVLGGGCSEMLMSCAVDEEVRKVKGMKAIAAEALQIPPHRLRSHLPTPDTTLPCRSNSTLSHLPLRHRLLLA
jgi:hypothetical protein